MFYRIVSSAIAAASLAIGMPAFAGEGPPFGVGLGASFDAHFDDSSHPQESAETSTTIVDENVSAAAPDEGQQVPAKYEGPSTQPNSDEDPFNRSMDAGG